MNRWNQADRLKVFKQIVGEHHSPMDLVRRFFASTTFRFLLLAIAITGVTFAVRTSDAFQSAQFAAIKAETRLEIASAANFSAIDAKPATQITAADPRLLKAVALKREERKPAKPAAKAGFEHAGLAEPSLLCKAIGGASWTDSALFADHKECVAHHSGEGFAISQIARGEGDDQVDTIRLKLDVVTESATEEAASSLSEDLDATLKVAELKAPSSFLKSVAKLETARAEAGSLQFSLEPEIAHPNRYTLVVQKTADTRSERLIRRRPE